MRTASAVSIDDYFSAGKPAVAVRTAYFESARGVDEIFGFFVEKFLGDSRFDDVFFNVAP